MANGSAHSNQSNCFGETEADRVKWAGSVGQTVLMSQMKLLGLQALPVS